SAGRRPEHRRAAQAGRLDARPWRTAAGRTARVGVLMSERALAGLLRSLAEQAERLGAGIAESMARFNERTADIAEANVDRILRTDDEIGASIARAGRPPATAPIRDVSSVPLGFTDQDAYNEFVGVLNDGLAEAGFGRTTAAFQGSSITG